MATGDNADMHVLLDTSVICADFPIRRNAFKLLLKEGRDGKFGILLSRVVLEEATTKYAESLEETLKKADAPLRKLRDVFGVAEAVPLDLDVDLLKEAYAKRLEDAFAEGQAVMLDYPGVTHEALVRRVLDRRKPSRSKDQGYRDSLIWEQLIEFAGRAEGHIALVSMNVKDFGEETDSLAQELQEELDERGIGRDRVSLFTSLDDLVKQEVPSERHLLPELEQLMSDDERFGELFWRALSDATEFGTPVTLSWRDKHLESPQLWDFSLVGTPRFEDARNLDDQHVLVYGRLEGTVGVMALTDHEGLDLIVEVEEVSLLDESDAFVWPTSGLHRVLVHRSATLIFEATYLPAEKIIVGTNVVEVKVRSSESSLPPQDTSLF